MPRWPSTLPSACLSNTAGTGCQGQDERLHRPWHPAPPALCCWQGGSRTNLLPPQIHLALFEPQMEFTQNFGLPLTNFFDNSRRLAYWVYGSLDYSKSQISFPEFDRDALIIISALIFRINCCSFCFFYCCHFFKSKAYKLLSNRSSHVVDLFLSADFPLHFCPCSSACASAALFYNTSASLCVLSEECSLFEVDFYYCSWSSKGKGF